MNSDLARLQAYPFKKLTQLRDGVVANAALSPIALGIGEPKHPPPEFVLQTLRDNLDGIANYPLTKGSPALRQSIAAWLSRRFKLPAESL
ncbi:MAG: succinyldiaminopimelate transaminase, partial [Gammaproteobacteria bacterium]|nr:succinyldiaminopimelate transaminase [Gammaproteobacteria bacterium]